MSGRIEYYGNIVRDGLVLCLDAAKKDSYPGTGTTWRDIAGGVITGSLVNGPTFDSANAGSIVFDGTNDYVNTFTPDLTTTATIEMWCKIKSGYSGKMFCGWLNYSVWCGNGHIGYNTANSDLYGINVSVVNSLGLVNNWKHYIFEMRSDVSYSNNKIFINGSEQITSRQLGSENVSNRNFNNGLGRISGWRRDTAYPMPMDCSMFRVYNRALSETEILQNYNATKGRYL